MLLNCSPVFTAEPVTQPITDAAGRFQYYKHVRDGAGNPLYRATVYAKHGVRQAHNAEPFGVAIEQAFNMSRKY